MPDPSKLLYSISARVLGLLNPDPALPGHQLHRLRQSQGPAGTFRVGSGFDHQSGQRLCEGNPVPWAWSDEAHTDSSVRQEKRKLSFFIHLQIRIVPFTPSFAESAGLFHGSLEFFEEKNLELCHRIRQAAGGGSHNERDHPPEGVDRPAKPAQIL